MAHVSIKKPLGGNVESLHNEEGFSVVANWTSETRDGSTIRHFKMADQSFQGTKAIGGGIKHALWGKENNFIVNTRGSDRQKSPKLQMGARIAFGGAAAPLRPDAPAEVNLDCEAEGDEYFVPMIGVSVTYKKSGASSDAGIFEVDRASARIDLEPFDPGPNTFCLRYHAHLKQGQVVPLPPLLDPFPEELGRRREGIGWVYLPWSPLVSHYSAYGIAGRGVFCDKVEEDVGKRHEKKKTAIPLFVIDVAKAPGQPCTKVAASGEQSEREACFCLVAKKRAMMGLDRLVGGKVGAFCDHLRSLQRKANDPFPPECGAPPPTVEPQPPLQKR